MNNNFGEYLKSPYWRFEAAESGRFLLWLPVCLGAGIALYFSLADEPSSRPVLITGAVLVLCLVAVRHRPALRSIFIGGFVAWAGLALAAWETSRHQAPIIERKTGPALLRGVIKDVERYPGGHERALIHPSAIDDFAKGELPGTVRITVRTKGEVAKPGDRVGLLVMLFPPPQPAAPGAYDFSRRAYFDGLGAVGIALGPLQVLEQEAENGLGLALNRLRDEMARQVFNAAPSAAGGVMAALLTGKRSYIPEEVQEDLRRTGLAHLLAISGLHLGLLSGLVFLIVRGGLALFPRIALYYPIKKWAVLAGALAAAVYLGLSGATVPTVRAFLMLFLVVVAVLSDRLAITMRLVALAAFVILAISPHLLLSISFQMSFAAVVALVGVYERYRLRRPRPELRSLPETVWLYVLGVIVTSLVAGAATDLFAAYHFNRIATFAVIANLVAVPVMGLWIMPWVVACLVLFPLGLEQLAIEPALWGITLVIETAREVGSWPGAVLHIPAMPNMALTFLVIGALWLLVWRSRIRWAGLALMGTGAVLAASVARPDLLIEERGKLIALRLSDGTLSLSSARAAPFVATTWLQQNAQTDPHYWHKSGTELACDAAGCVAEVEKGSERRRITIANGPAALAEDCWRADILISKVPLRQYCPQPALVIDRFDLWREGAHSIVLEPSGGIVMRTVAQSQGRRPWSLYARRTARFSTDAED